MADIKVYTINEVVDILKVTRRTVYTYLAEGKLKAIKMGKYWRVTEDNLKEFLSADVAPLTRTESTRKTKNK